MKSKLKPKLEETLKDIVKTEHYNDVRMRFLKAHEFSTFYPEVRIKAEETKHGISLRIPNYDSYFVEYEELKPNVWYPADKFDYNPDNYWLAEFREGGFIGFAKINTDVLYRDTIKFMYIEPTSEE